NPRLDSPTSLKVLSPEKWKGYFLAFDPDGDGDKPGRIFLTAREGDNTRWRTARVKGQSSFVRTLQADSGKVKGWHLDAEAEQAKDDKGNKMTAHRLFLSPKPKKVPK